MVSYIPSPPIIRTDGLLTSSAMVRTKKRFFSSGESSVWPTHSSVEEPQPPSIRSQAQRDFLDGTIAGGGVLDTRCVAAKCRLATAQRAIDGGASLVIATADLDVNALALGSDE